MSAQPRLALPQVQPTWSLLPCPAWSAPSPGSHNHQWKQQPSREVPKVPPPGPLLVLGLVCASGCYGRVKHVPCHLSSCSSSAQACLNPGSLVDWLMWLPSLVQPHTPSWLPVNQVLALPSPSLDPTHVHTDQCCRPCLAWPIPSPGSLAHQWELWPIVGVPQTPVSGSFSPPVLTIIGRC